MLTRIEPEKTGPITTYAPSSTAFCASAFATPGVRLRVARRVLDLPAEDAAGRVDLLDGELHAVVEVRARRCAGAGQLDQADDLDRLLCDDRGHRERDGERRADAGDAFHRSLLRGVVHAATIRPWATG
jgi:hypothetical protein